MKIEYVNIINFRSIENITINFSPKCRILVGINESGKTNVLRALSLIDKDVKFSKDDIREPLSTEKDIKESYIRFVFKLSNEDNLRIFENLKLKILTDDIEKNCLQTDQKKINFLGFCNKAKEGLYHIDLLKQSRNARYWSLQDDYKLLGNWAKPKPNCPQDYSVDINGEKIFPSRYLLINADYIKNIPVDYLDKIDVTYVYDLIGKELISIIESIIPKVIFWQYNENNLLPPTISIDSFVLNPDICIPLKNMFVLAGISNISQSITEARQISENKFRNLLKRVAEHTTKHFRDVWKEYKNIKFSLVPSGNNIDANILEKNYWRLSQRSDGFKRFVTFLLIISINVKVDLLKDSILLIDEPDISLHPKGIRYLLQELIKISNKNYVILSTHSIFMIDKDNISRHVIVKKDYEKTKITNADKSNIIDEEVLYNALQFSLFEIIKKNNILFEGWRDKKLFQTAIKKVPNKFVDQLDKLIGTINQQYGFCHAEGVKDIRNITPLLELAKRKCLIISDCDNPAIEKQKEYRKIMGYGIWKRYDEVFPRCKAITSEDFVNKDYFYSKLEMVLKRNSIAFEKTSINKNRIEETKKMLLKNRLDNRKIKDIIDSLKNEIFNDLKPANISDDYYEFLKNIYAYLEKN